MFRQNRCASPPAAPGPAAPTGPAPARPGNGAAPVLEGPGPSCAYGLAAGNCGRADDDAARVVAVARVGAVAAEVGGADHGTGGCVDHRDDRRGDPGDPQFRAVG